ncbi:MAG: glycoside hydrolase family 2 TIM barrel-domain containing protein [Mangrovibacterium sp.]
MKKTVLLIATMLACFGLMGQNTSSFNADWKFSFGDKQSAECVDFDDSDWRVLTLPHDWSIEGDYSEKAPMGGSCGYLPAGIAWYRKTIDIPASWKNKSVAIAFDGVYMNSTVYANGIKLGNRPYGWTSFEYDISHIVNKNETITFAVLVDNQLQPSARWYTGSGIYANTWIKVKNKILIPTNGIFISTNKNEIGVRTNICNIHHTDKNISVVNKIIDKDGRVLEICKENVKINARDTVENQQIITINEPILWDVENPYLYTLLTEVCNKNKVLDQQETKFGIRDVVWKPESGMWLNGRNVKLKGVCNHQDAGAFGAAVPDKILRFRIQQLKNMGVNAIRTAHNPQTPQFYDMCDEMGMLVMDEIFDGWGKKASYDYGAMYFREWWKQDLSDFIKRDRNHPSVIIYSVGNETRGEVGDSLVNWCHELDSTRPVTSGDAGAEHMDIYGMNGGSEKMGFFDTLKKDRVFIGTEHTHTWQVRGYYRTKTWYRDGYPNKNQKPYCYPDLTEKEVFFNDWTENSKKANGKQEFNSSYDNAMVRLNSRQNIEMLRDIPNFAGSFRWTGYDYIGEASYVHGGWPFKAFMGGAIDIANFPKDLYYLYQSQWTTKPMIHILPHWTHPSVKEGTKIPVWVYSNCDEVELFFNDKSLGKKKKGFKWDEMQRQWMVAYAKGEITAIGYNQGEKVISQTIRTANQPSDILLSVDGGHLENIKDDIVQVRVSTIDDKGEFYPYGENRCYFKVFGGGHIRALDNGSPIDTERHFEAESRIAFYGLTRAYIQSDEESGDVNLLVSSILGEKKQVTSNKVSITSNMLCLRGNTFNPQIEIYYSTDGNDATLSSFQYTEPFEVKLGSTVKAIVVVDGVIVHKMEERFAVDEGFVWHSETGIQIRGIDQAEKMKIYGARESSQGENFNGSGFVEFTKGSDSYVEWYQENDGSSGEVEMLIRYAANKSIKEKYRVELSVNNVKTIVNLLATDDYLKKWKLYRFKTEIENGANIVRIRPIDGEGFCLDELGCNSN